MPLLSGTEAPMLALDDTSAGADEPHPPLNEGFTGFGRFAAALAGVGLAAWGASLLPQERDAPELVALPIVAVVVLARLVGFGPTLLATAVGLGILIPTLFDASRPSWGLATRLGLFAFI